MPDVPVRNLLTDPACKPQDLGLPLPPVTHAVSVALPCWQDVIDYEEEHPRIAAALQAGYPRFFLHPLVTQLFAEATRHHAGPDEGCLVFPSAVSAQRAADYTLRKTGHAIVTRALGAGPLQAVIFPESLRKTVREYWRYCGEVVSSRLAAFALSGWNRNQAAMLETEGHIARQKIRARLAGLHGVDPGDIFLFPSGMNAMAMAHRLLIQHKPGLPTAQLDFPYVDVLRIQQEFGSGVEFFPVADALSVGKTITLAKEGRIAGVFAEVPSNPLLSCVDIGYLSDHLRAAGVPLVLDDTVATAVNLNALACADLVSTSLTKAFSGTGDVLAGALMVNPHSPWHNEFRAALEAETQWHEPFWAEDAIVLEVNSRDFVERCHRMNANAAALTDFLKTHPDVSQVWYPGDVSEFGRMARPGGGRGCLFSFALQNEAAAARFYDALTVSKGPSLGTNFTLCCPYTLLAHYQELEWAAACGVPRHLLRVSAGLEETQDLIQRFSAALEA